MAHVRDELEIRYGEKKNINEDIDISQAGKRAV